MYRSSFLLFRKFYRYYVIGTLIIFSLKFMNESDLFNDIGVDVAYFSLWTYLAYSTCVSILSPEADEHPSDAAPFARFYFRFAGLFLPLYLARLAFFIALPYFLRDLPGDLSRVALVAVIVLVEHFLECILFLVQFSLFGLALPSAISGEIEGEKGKFTNKLKLLPQVFIRLLIGPVLVSSIGVAIYVGTYSINPAMKSLLLDGWIPNIIGISLFVFSISVQSWAVVMTFWILSKSYIRMKFGERGMQVVYKYN